MAQILDDNTVVPSFQGLQPRGAARDTGNLNNLALRMGEVKDIVYSDDTRSITKKFTEYTVEVQHRDNRAAGTTTLYRGCLVSNLFGGAADSFRYTLRKDDQSKSAKDGVGIGSKVLMLCVNGQTTRAMIVGGLRDIVTDDQDTDDPKAGHNLHFEFNGVSFDIDKEGAATIQFRGATKADGSLDADAGASADNGPTTIQISKEGNLKLSTKDDKQLMLLDHKNKKADFLFEKWGVTVNDKVDENYGGDWQVVGDSNVVLEAKQDFKAQAGSAMNLEAGGNVNIKSAGVMTGSASDATMMGTTYRNAQQSLNQTLAQQLTIMSVQLGIAGAAANGPLMIPTVGGTIAGPIIGQALIQCVTALIQMTTALATFEAKSATYLSTKNKSD